MSRDCHQPSTTTRADTPRFHGRPFLAIFACSLLLTSSALAQAPSSEPSEPEAEATHTMEDHHRGTHAHDHGGHDGHGDAAHGDAAHGDADAHSSHELHHDFSDAERWAAVFDDPERLAWQRPDEVVEHMSISDGQTVVDLGAGTGFFLPYLGAATPHGKVLALDPEANLVEHMRRRAAEAEMHHVEVRQIPYDDPQLAAGSVDRIVIVDTWHHIEDRSLYAAKLLASLTEDGKLFIVDFTLDSPSGPPKEHRLAAERVIEELEAGGFEAEAIDETLPRQYIVVGRRSGS